MVWHIFSMVMVALVAQGLCHGMPLVQESSTAKSGLRGSSRQLTLGCCCLTSELVCDYVCDCDRDLAEPPAYDDTKFPTNDDRGLDDDKFPCECRDVCTDVCVEYC